MLGSEYCYRLGMAGVERIVLNSTDVQSFLSVHTINSSLSLRTSIISFSIAIVVR